MKINLIFFLSAVLIKISILEKIDYVAQLANTHSFYLS